MKSNFSIFPGHLVLMIMLNIGLTGILHGQDSILISMNPISQKDLSDVIRAALNKPPKIESESEGSLLLLPIIGSKVPAWQLPGHFNNIPVPEFINQKLIL